VLNFTEFHCHLPAGYQINPLAAWIKICFTYQRIFYKKGRPSARGSHMSGVWGREKPRQAFPPQICGEAASNPRPGDSVRQLSPLHQAKNFLYEDKFS